MPNIVLDARGRAFDTSRPVQRIVSLVPSWTESLFAFGAGERVVGITDFCVEPTGAVDTIQKIGGTKNPRVQEILALEPDLVIANVEENRKPDVEWLEARGIPVFVTFARSVRTAIQELQTLGELLGTESLDPVVEPIEEAYAAARASQGKIPRARVFVAIWKDPWMTANADTFMSDLIELSGGENVFRERERRFPLAADLGLADPREILGERDTRYPRVSIREVIERAPDLILLPDEPYPFSAQDVDELREYRDLPAVQNDRIVVLDGKVLTWYGVRMGENLRFLQSLIHGN